MPSMAQSLKLIDDNDHRGPSSSGDNSGLYRRRGPTSEALGDQARNQTLLRVDCFPS